MISNKETHTTKILKLLKSKGKVSNLELRKVAWRYPARVLDLKHEGHLICSVHDKGPLWFYIYDGHQDDGVAA
ncbi:hypothetical protein BS618_27745 [Rhodococcus erythropolis]|uniref:hypothetical protein n=1 Tax=Rhodococcus TaxID=1827 RepID=UPI000937146F|nr:MULTISPECIES: hypothetical protein [Rhodococcus]MBP2522447.1 hypothetical protein [Rhodococcus sp. PvP104]MCZ4546340.1 hypothetical protein [Rhodococcus qingshengii]MDA3632020.1 hypothetical protein [Rhodococcus sp. C-2]OKA11596.1 hypothetical protein BS618_27745 [Rhodococcus erythropolis]